MFSALDGDWDSLEDWRAFLNGRFRDTARAARLTSPFWHEYFEDMDLASHDLYGDPLPVVVSDDIRDNQPPATDTFRLRLETPVGKRVLQSSGTTGEPKSFFYSPDDWERDARRMGARTFELAGIGPDDVMASYYPKTGTNISGPAVDDVLTELGAGVVSFPDDWDLQQQFEGMDMFDVTVVSGLTSHIEALARDMNEAGLDLSGLGIDTVVVAGEASAPEKRDWIGEQFGAETVDYYGSTEFCFSGIEAGNGNMLLYEDQVHVDVYDEEGRKLEDGEPGRMVFTYLMEEEQVPGRLVLATEIGDYGRVVDRHRDVEGYPVTEIDIQDKIKNVFTLGALDFSPDYFEERMHKIAEPGEITGHYRLEIWDEVGEPTALTFRVETTGDIREGYADQLYEDIVTSHPYMEDTLEKGVEFAVETGVDVPEAPGKREKVVYVDPS